MSIEFCPQCHAPVGAGRGICGTCGSNLGNPSSDATIDPVPTDPVQADPVPTPFAPPTLAPPVVGAVLQPPPLSGAPVHVASPVGPPPLTGAPGTGTGPNTVIPTAGEPKPGGRKWLLPAIVVVALLAGAGAWLAFGRDDDDGSKVVEATTIELPTTITVVATTVTTPPVTDAPTTDAPTTVPATTVAATTTLAPTTTVAPPTTPAPPAWVPPVPPNPPVLAGPGAPYAVSEPLAGGMPGATAQPSLLFAQQVFDQLAANDWFTALSHFLFRAPGEVETPLTPDQLQSEWQVSDRLSLLLIDATPDPNGVAYDLRVGVLANIENSTTSVLCGHLYVEIAPNQKVIQLGTFTIVSQGEPPMQPEEFLNQPARIADLIAKCP